MKDNEKILNELYAEFGSNICLAPFFAAWYSTSVTGKNSTLRPCSVAYGDWSMTTKTLSDEINSERWIKLKKEFISGSYDKLTTCAGCNVPQRSGATPIRHLNNKSYVEHLNINIAEELRKIISNDFKHNEIYVLEYFPSNYCNFECIMCNGGASSRRATFEIKNLHQPNLKFNTQPLSSDFYHLIEKLTLLNFTGGETIMQPEVHHLIDYLIEKDIAKNIIISMLTNASSFPDILIEKFKKFKDVFYTLSIDSTNEIIEYQRRGAKWNEVSQNAIKINQNFGAVVNCVLTSVNILNFPKLVKWLYENKLDIVFISAENTTGYLDVGSLPIELREIALKRLDAAKQQYTEQWPIDLIENVINVINTTEFSEYKLKTFVKKIKIEDSASKKTLVEVVPEWKPYFE